MQGEIRLEIFPAPINPKFHRFIKLPEDKFEKQTLVSNKKTSVGEKENWAFGNSLTITLIVVSLIQPESDSTNKLTGKTPSKGNL